MASIQTGIQLADNFTAPLMHIINSVNMAVTQMEALNSSMNADVDTATLEGVRNELNQASVAAANLNSELSQVNAPAASASSSVSQIGNQIQQNTNNQRQFNSAVNDGASQIDGLVGKVVQLAAAYATVETAKKIVSASDDLVQTRARLDMMNDGLQSTDYLVKMVYASAQDARGEFGSMADVVARFGNNAKDAFGSTEEVVAFANLIQKQMTVAGASTQEASNAMLQLSQALGSGVLRGDELNSIFEQAPNLIQNIADYLNVPIGKIREMAQEGQLTADIVKNAIFAATDQINANFESMPMTWGQVWTMFQNDAIMAFEPVLNKINELANNEEFQNSLNSVISGLSSFASFALDVFNMVIQVTGFVADNWNTLMPIIVGVTSAVIAYKAAHTGMQIISSIVSATAAAYGIEASQVTAATVAQYGFNAALNACPFVAILSLIAGVVAGIAYVNNEFGSLKITLMVFEQIFKTTWENFLYFLSMVEVKVAEFVANFKTGFYSIGEGIRLIMSSAAAEVLTIIENMVNGAIDLINGLISAVNKIPGVSIDAIEDVTFGTTAQIEYEAQKQASANNIANYAAEQQANVDAVRQWSDSYGAEIAKNQADREAAIDKAMTEQANAEKNQNTFDYNKYLNFKQKDFGGNAANIANSAAQTAANTADTANNTAKVADAVAVTAEDLKYLRDMAETETINRYTTASITVNQTNHNTVNNEMDLDGVTEHLRSTMEEQMAAAAEGVH